MSRYNSRNKVINDTEEYRTDEIFEDRGVQQITQYQTPQFKRLTEVEYNRVPFQRYYWKNGDRFWKLAAKFYGDKTKWWVIAGFNFIPTEAEVEEGQEIRIPTNLSIVMGLFT